jgi:hypothetical protein
MSQVYVSMAMSLDGFITGPHDDAQNRAGINGNAPDGLARGRRRRRRERRRGVPTPPIPLFVRLLEERADPPGASSAIPGADGRIHAASV